MDVEFGSVSHALVVDGDAAVAHLIETTLRAEGWAVTTACDGWQGLESAIRRPPDLITLEVDLPHDSGIYFYRGRHRWASLCEVPILVVTGMEFGDGEPPESAFAREMRREGLPPPLAFLTKPIGVSHLRRALKRVPKAGWIG